MIPPSRGPRPPHHITENSPVLVSHIPLPPQPSIAYAKFIPTQQQEQQHMAVELARQQIINGVRRKDKCILESLLPVVCVGKEEVVLWVFSIRSLVSGHEHGSEVKGKHKEHIPAIEELDTLGFDGLQRCDLAHFTPSGLYPCSLECAKLFTPCSSCTRMPSILSAAQGDASAPSSSTTLFPRLPLRPIYTLFINAVRDRLIDDICSASHPSVESKPGSYSQAPGRPSGATRLGHGFLSSGEHMTPMWGRGWEQRSHSRPLIHTALDVYLSPTALHIRPLPTLTRLLPVPVWCTPSPSSLPLSPGTPLLLAPYPTPAFYISTHAGASISHALRTQFWDALVGLGASAFPARPRFGHSPTSSYSMSPKLPITNGCVNHTPTGPFVLVFIPLLNPQGEPKGVTALWPAQLTFIDTSPNRPHLTNLPEMPGTQALLTPPRGSAVQPSAQGACSTFSLPLSRRRSSVRWSIKYLNRAQRVFRAIELSSHKRVAGVPIHGTAKATAGFVENIARERERERERANQERMRRDRDMKEGKSLASSTLTPQNPTAQLPQASSEASGSDAASPKVLADMARPALSWHSVPTNFFAKAAQDSVVHSFYPSPPDWNPVSSSQNSGTSEPSTGNIAATSVSSTINVPTQPASQSQSGPSVIQQTTGNPLDLANGIDLGMDIDLDDMSMGINLEHTMSMLDVNMGVNLEAAGLMDGGFGSFTDPFTDDDFNYFDTAPIPEPMPVVVPGIRSPLHHLNAAESDVDGWLASGLAGTDQRGSGVTHPLHSVTPTSVGFDAPTHDSSLSRPLDSLRMSEDDSELLPPAPDLIPSSPAKSPWSPGNPPTPSLELNTPLLSPTGKRMFEPIRFGHRHYLADGKYRDATGKFAFPNTIPRVSSHLDLSPTTPATSTPEKEDGWKVRYDAITDPRVGVINRLRGVKRKLQGEARSSKNVNGRLRDAEWESIYDQTYNAELVESSSSEEDEEDMEEPEPEQDPDDDMSSQSHPSRPSTPPPSGPPLTAALLYFHLHHAHLLPLGMPMRPSFGDLASNNDQPPTLISVPTPVSPAAALGSAAERNKTLELLAQAVAKEAVENHTWAQAWGLLLESPSTGHTSQVCKEVLQADLKHIADLMGRVTGLNGPSSLSNLLDSFLTVSSKATSAPPAPGHVSKLQLLQHPRLSIGRAGLVLQMLPSAVRFWEKEGLGPRGGTKDIIAFALFEEGEEKSALVEAWMERVRRAYSARGFGNHIAGNAGTCERGLVPLQFEAVRKILSNLISALPREPQHIVIYIIAPPSICSSLRSSALRAIIMGHKRVSKLHGQHDFDQDRVLIHFVPDFFITDPYTYPTSRHVGLEWFVNSVYDRLLRVTLRQTSRLFWEYNPPFENRFQAPAFILARNTPAQTHLEWDERPSLNVLDRHTFLHVGYRLSKCKKWLLAACIDERGEAHDVAVWGVPNQNDSQAFNANWMVSIIWIFVKQFAQRADTEWRIVISKLGEIGESEVEAWISHLETMVSTHTGPPVHVSLVCAQNDIPLPFLCPADTMIEKRLNAGMNTGAVFEDVSSLTYSAFFAHRTPIISPELLCPWEHPSLVVPAVPPDEDVGSPSQTNRSPIGILPLCTTTLLRVPNHTNDTTVEALYIHLLYAYKSDKSTLKKTTHEVHSDITRNWYDLAVLTRERWHFPQQGQLPFHLAALELMSGVLDPEILNPEVKETDYLGT